MRCVDPNDFREEAGSPEDDDQDYLDLLLAEEEDDHVDDEGGRRRLGHFAMVHSHESVTHRRLYDDSSGSTIDILVVWTKKRPNV
jgi:hypothetical protein